VIAGALLSLYLGAMVVFAWPAVLSGADIVCPWYRALPPEGLADPSEYPRRLLLSSGKTSEWHNVGMEWKEHVSWIAPIAITMVAYAFAKYGRAFARVPHVRTAVLTFALVAFIATGAVGLAIGSREAIRSRRHPRESRGPPLHTPGLRGRGGADGAARGVGPPVHHLFGGAMDPGFRRGDGNGSACC
jgi:hypothetical protein